jgi:hypothetical protein
VISNARLPTSARSSGQTGCATRRPSAARVERGELPADTDPAAMIDMLADPIYLRRFIQGRPMTAAQIDALATRVVRSA